MLRVRAGLWTAYTLYARCGVGCKLVKSKIDEIFFFGFCPLVRCVNIHFFGFFPNKNVLFSAPTLFNFMYLHNCCFFRLFLGPGYLTRY